MEGSVLKGLAGGEYEIGRGGPGTCRGDGRGEAGTGGGGGAGGGGGGGVCGLDGEVGQDAVEQAGQGPVGRADEVHEGGYQQAADEHGIDEDGEAQSEAELRQLPGAEHERSVDQDHQAGRGGGYRTYPAMA